ncbi:DUF4386 domain-containing protein [Candidatus Lokiarchaeum ossiferum]|uniref:DUF4386 domain-containing protein n=1 Tax=Candidatus Lokiarchaeum ossiferum TaxID=2951803 RepID=UPI00352D8F3B
MDSIQSYQKQARASGMLFLIAILTGIIGAVLFGGLSNFGADITQFSENRLKILFGSFMILLMGITCASIAIPLYPIMKKQNQPMALAAVSFRLLESVSHIFNVILFLVLLNVSSEYAASEVSNQSYYVILNSTLSDLSDSLSLIGTICFNIGALMYSLIIYQTKLLPRWMASFALVGIFLALMNQILVFFGVYTDSSIIATMFHLPTLVYELIFGFTMVIKGFNVEAIQQLDQK